MQEKPSTLSGKLTVEGEMCGSTQGSCWVCLCSPVHPPLPALIGTLTDVTCRCHHCHSFRLRWDWAASGKNMDLVSLQPSPWFCCDPQKMNLDQVHFSLSSVEWRHKCGPCGAVVTSQFFLSFSVPGGYSAPALLSPVLLSTACGFELGHVVATVFPVQLKREENPV